MNKQFPKTQNQVFILMSILAIILLALIMCFIGYTEGYTKGKAIVKAEYQNALNHWLREEAATYVIKTGDLEGSACLTLLIPEEMDSIDAVHLLVTNTIRFGHMIDWK